MPKCLLFGGVVEKEEQDAAEHQGVAFHILAHVRALRKHFPSQIGMGALREHLLQRCAAGKLKQRVVFQRLFL